MNMTEDQRLFYYIRDNIKTPFRKARALAELTYRVRAQSTAFEVFTMLETQVLVTLQGLHPPINLRIPTR